MAALRWGYKKSRELSRRLGVYRGEHAPGHPAFAQTSSALCGDHLGPVDIAAPDFTYTEADNKAIDDYHRNNGEYSHLTLERHFIWRLRFSCNNMAFSTHLFAFHGRRQLEKFLA